MFEIHEQAYYDEEGADPERDGQIVKSGKLYPDAVTLCHPTRAYLFPKPVDYPFEEVLKKVPFLYLENTIAYQLAYALHTGIEEIGLWGVHQMNEYIWEKPSVLYLIGLLQGAGRVVHNVPGSPLFMSRFKAGRYGLSGGARFKEII